MSICIVSACWKRPEVTRAFIRHHMSLTPAPAGIIMAGSPGDGHEGVDFTGVNYFHTPNVLGAKWNAAIRAAREVEATHYIYMGSDDFLDQAMWDYFQRYTGHYIGLLDLYFHDAATERTLYWPGYVGPRRLEPIGCGKVISREAMERIGWEPFGDARNRTVDYDQHHKLLRSGVTCDRVRMRSTGGICVDLKTGINMNSMGVIARQPRVMWMPMGWMRRKHAALLDAMVPGGQAS